MALNPDESIDDYNDRMNREAERDFNARSGGPRSAAGTVRATAREIVVADSYARPAMLPAGVAHPLEISPADFKRSLQVRSDNRIVLVQWLKDALKPGLDYGRIHYVKKSVCDRGADCKNPLHFTKDTLFKPGSQKICGMLGVTPTFPNLARYEEAALSGVKIESIILRCHILAVNGQVVSEGVGARSLTHDYGDLNKSLKMASKSAEIDATLRMAGLSEIFSHPDVPPPAPGETEEPDHARVPMGTFRGQYWADVSLKYLNGLIESPKAPAIMKQGAQAELARRPKSEFEFDDNIPY